MDSRSNPVDVHYSLAESPPKSGKMFKCAVIADLNRLTHPEFSDSPKDHYQHKGSEAQLLLDQIRDRADAIRCISKHTERQVHIHLGLSPDRTFVSYLGLVPRGCSSKPVQLPSANFLLAVGRIDPQKNFARLIKSFDLLESKDLHLVIAGKEGWRHQEVYDVVKKLSLQGRVHFLKYVPDEKLIWLYQNAAAFVCPAISEGFGLPVLEAMHYSCSVAASNGGAIPEVIGDCGILFDPLNVEEMASAIQRALDQPKVEMAKERTKLFTFEPTSLEVMNQFRARI